MKLKSEIWELILTLVLVAGCHATKNLNQVRLPAFDKEGHRGCRGLMPENTIAAMLHAIDLGVTTLEMDAMITKDGEVILSHDPFFNHEITTLPGGDTILVKDEKAYRIYGMTYAETLRYDVGLKMHPKFPGQRKLPAHKPLLKDVIDSVEAYCNQNNLPHPFYNIETKTQPATDNINHPSPEKFVELLMGVINGKSIADRVIIQSFDFRTLKIVHHDFPSVKTAALIESADKGSPKQHISELGFVPTIYSPEFTLVNKLLANECHGLSMKLVPWTVNDKSKIDELKGLGVDGIISDYPNLFR